MLEEAAIGNGLKLNFSTDNEQQVADNLAGNSPEKKTKEAVAQGDDMSEASLSVLRKAGTFFGSDISINGAVTTPEISVQYALKEHFYDLTRVSVARDFALYCVIRRQRVLRNYKSPL